MRRRDALMTLIAGAGGLATGGCHWLTAWAIAPRHPTAKVKQEYPLEADRLAIIIYCGTDTLFNYPTAGLEISRDLVNEILLHLKGRVREILHPVEVAQWQESNLEWPNLSLGELALRFKVDTVLYLEIEQYTGVEERSANLLRGRIKARIQVAKAAAAHNPVYETHIETVFPEDRPVGVLEYSERKILSDVGVLFSRAVIRKFYDHEVEVKGGKA